MKPKYKQMIRDIEEYFPNGKFKSRSSYNPGDIRVFAPIPNLDATIHIRRRGIWHSFGLYVSGYFSTYSHFKMFMSQRGWIVD